MRAVTTLIESGSFAVTWRIPFSSILSVIWRTFCSLEVSPVPYTNSCSPRIYTLFPCLPLSPCQYANETNGFREEFLMFALHSHILTSQLFNNLRSISTSSISIHIHRSYAQLLGAEIRKNWTNILTSILFSPFGFGQSSGNSQPPIKWLSFQSGASPW